MKLILMRHAESQHNAVKNQIKRKYPLASVKNTRQYRYVRIDPSLRDEPLTEQGIIQAELASQGIDWENVQLILVSPMKRCLETCKRMLSKISRKIEVRVDPLLKGRLSNIWGYGSSVNDLENSYPQFIFQNLTESSDLPWFIRIMSQEKRKLYQEKLINEQELYSDFHEDYSQFQERVDKLKPLVQNYRNKLKQGSTMLIITHSCVLRTMTSKYFDQKGKGVSDIKFRNAKPVYIEQKAIFSWRQHNKSTCQLPELNQIAKLQ